MNLRGGVLFTTMLLGLLVVAPAANASDLYVSPTGSMSPNTCTNDLNPCALAYALENVAREDDSVLLDTSAGPYTVASPITVSADGVYLVGETGNPAVINTGANGALIIDANNVGVFDVTLHGSGSIAPLQFSPYALGSGGSGITADNTSTGAAGALSVQSDIQLTDSLFVSATNSGSTILAGDGSFLNVTSISTGTGPALTATDGVAGSARVFTLNSILQSTAANPDALANGSHTHLAIYQSNLNVTGGSGGGHIDEDPAVPNQSGPANLVGIYHEQSSSPTVDAGYLDEDYPSIYQLDLDGDSRCIGAAPDIGADEFDNGLDCFGATGADGNEQLPSLASFDFTAPVVSAFKAAKKKGKVNAFTFTSTEPGFATLTYQRKKGKKFKSAGTQRRITVAGKNSIKPKKLKKGSYKVTLRILDASGNESSAKKLNFKVR